MGGTIPVNQTPKRCSHLVAPASVVMVLMALHLGYVRCKKDQSRPLSGLLRVLLRNQLLPVATGLIGFRENKKLASRMHAQCGTTVSGFLGQKQYVVKNSCHVP